MKWESIHYIFIFGINRCDIQFSFYIIWIHITVITCAKNQLWWGELSSLISYETDILSLIQTLDSGSILFGKVMSVFDELPNSSVVKELIVHLLTESMFDYFKLFDLLVLTWDILVVRLLFLAFNQNLPVLLPSWQLIPHFKTVFYNNQWFKLIEMKLSNDMTLNDMEINSLHIENNWLTHLSFKNNWRKSSLLIITDSLQWKPNHEYEVINE